MAQARQDRPSFSPNAIAVILLLILIGIAVWKAVYQLDLVPAGHPLAASARSKIIKGAAYTILGTMFVASAGAAGCFFAFSRSRFAANAAASLIIAIPVVLLSIQAYNTNRNPPPPTKSAGPLSFSQQLKQQAERERQGIDNLTNRPTAPAPSPSRPPASPSNVPPSTVPSTVPSTPTPRPTPPPAAPAPKQANPNIAAALNRVKDTVVAQITDSLAKVEPVLATLDKPPRVDKSALQKRLDNVKSARQTLATLSDSLQGMTERSWTEAQQAGAEQAEARSEAIRFTNAFEATQRRFASDALGRILEQAEQESELLLTNFGLWKIGPDGKVDAKDFTLKSRAQSARFFIETGLKTKDREVGKLKAD